MDAVVTERTGLLNGSAQPTDPLDAERGESTAAASAAVAHPASAKQPYGSATVGHNAPTATASPSSTVRKMGPGRNVGLDVFRGLCIISMVAAKDQGDYAKMYSVFEHEAWSSYSASDLVFPFFLFMVGCSIPFACRRRVPPAGAVWRRTAILFFTGVLFNAALSHFDWRELRIMGVLQRIAIGYVVGVSVHAYLPGGWTMLTALAACFLLVHTALTFGLYVPGCDERPGQVVSRRCTAQGYLDTAILGGRHLYFHLEYDAEGVLSTLPSCVCTFAGIAAGRSMLAWSGRERFRTAVWLAVGGGLICGALWLAAAYPNALPVSKPLFSPALLMLTVGWALVLLAACEWMSQYPQFDLLCKPGLWVGKNSFLIFAASFAVDYIVLMSVHVPQSGRSSATAAPTLKEWLFWHTARRWYGHTKRASSMFSLFFVAAWVALAYLLYRKRWFLSV